MRPRSVFVAVTAWAAVAVMPINMVVAQMSKEWSQCSGAEGAIADVIISGCSTVIQAGQDGPRLLATAFNNRGVAYKFKGEYDRALEDYEIGTRFSFFGSALLWSWLAVSSLHLCRS